MTIFDPSPVACLEFRGFNVHLKRDDLINLSTAKRGGISSIGSELPEPFSGNKARKLYHYLIEDYPSVRHVISYGSTQSNMLYSLSCLTKIRGWQLQFYVDHVAMDLKQNPRGNYAAALTNGAEIIEVGDRLNESRAEILADYVARKCAVQRSEKLLFIPEGGAGSHAEAGIRLLAEEISDWAADHGLKNLKVVLPSGTGSTALYLQRYFIQNRLKIEVLTCACVGGDPYLQQQWFRLEPDASKHPVIIPPPANANGKSSTTSAKYHFGKLYPEFYSIWRELKRETRVTFDLLYDPLGWICLINYLQSIPSGQIPEILYVHQGGLLGNESMLPRYRRKYPLISP